MPLSSSATRVPYSVWPWHAVAEALAKETNAEVRKTLERLLDRVKEHQSQD